jgi:hypothetical protein
VSAFSRPADKYAKHVLSKKVMDGDEESKIGNLLYIYLSLYSFNHHHFVPSIDKCLFPISISNRKFAPFNQVKAPILPQGSKQEDSKMASLR